MTCEFCEPDGLGNHAPRCPVELERKLSDREEWIARLLRSTHTLTCVYCGHEYPPGTPASGAPALTEHVKECKAHPMYRVQQRLNQAEKLLAAVSQLRDHGFLAKDAQLSKELMTSIEDFFIAEI
jgi:hypothetical protein